MPHSHLDEKFAQFARTGDRNALEFVFVHTEERLRHRAQRLLGDARAAEDLVQELFLALLLRCDTYASGRPCLPYLIGALHRRASTWQKRRALLQRLPVGPAGAPPDDEVPVAWARFRELLAAVEEALPQLPFASQDVVRSFLQDHKSPQEIGRALDRPAGTVRVQLHRGLRLLRDLLPRGFFALPLLLLLREAQAKPPLPASRPRLAPWLLAVTIAAGVLVCLPAFAPTFAATAHT
ncbi:MAG TPA: sigma-70 family RNA polymerase sigma factor, partial [Planctomycetota bacterium]|nr:sigma-70 family RNA polymerase sigma factor [Planctomycetota bacterium]